MKLYANDDKTKLAVLKLLNKDLAGIDELEEISAGEESNRNASFALALTYYQKQDYSLAMKTINAWLAKNSDDVEALLFKAKIFEAQDLVQNSFNTLQVALQKSSDNDNDDVLFMLAQNRLKASDLIASQNHLEHLIDINPQYKSAYTLLLRIKRSLNKEDEFFQLMTAIIQDDNNEYSWPRIILAQKALLENKFDYAEAFLADLSNENLSDAYFSTMMDIYFGKKNMTKINKYAQ